MLKGPEWEREIGIEWYITEHKGCGGRIKEEPEDFIVEEEGLNGKAEVAVFKGKRPRQAVQGEGKYLHVVLEKKNWETTEAIRKIAKVSNTPLNKISFAGTKDKRAITGQWISIQTTWEKIKEICIKDVHLHSPLYCNERLYLGALKGNHFSIVIRGAKSQPILPEKIPNYFGHQRFGVHRFVTHKVGKKLLEGDYEGAVLTYLCETSPFEPEETRKARERLRKTLDFEDALNYFPSNLKHERRILKFLSRRPIKEALRTFHPRLQSLFIHAFQSYLFNKILSEKLASGITETCAVPGYSVKLDDTEKDVLEKEGVDIKKFKDLKKFGTKGTRRKSLVHVKKRGGKNNRVKFYLEKGAYATIVLREVIKPSSPIGFLHGGGN